MLWNELLRKGNVSLLQSQSDSQYCVCRDYDETAKEDQQYEGGTYFCYWGDKEKKAYFLSAALELFRVRTERDYISRYRLEELTTKLAHGLKEFDEDYAREVFEEECELEEHEMEWLELTESEEDDDGL